MRKSLLSSLYIALCGGCKASDSCCQNRRFFCSLLPCHIRQVLWLSMTFSCGVEMVKSLSIIGTTTSLKRNETLYIVGICTGINCVFFDKSVVSGQVHQVDIRGKSSCYCGLHCAIHIKRQKNNTQTEPPRANRHFI